MIGSSLCILSAFAPCSTPIYAVFRLFLFDSLVMCLSSLLIGRGLFDGSIRLPFDRTTIGPIQVCLFGMCFLTEARCFICRWILVLLRVMVLDAVGLGHHAVEISVSADDTLFIHVWDRHAFEKVENATLAAEVIVDYEFGQ